VSAQVPFVDLARSHDPLQSELSAAIDAVVRRGDFILGEELARFEAEFAAYLGVEHAVGVASGTAAITIGLRACGIGDGDEVIVPAHTYIASALGVLHSGATPVLCDVGAESGLIDLDSAAAQVGERTAAILVVHLYGRACDMGAVAAFADRHGIAVVEDTAQAHGASWNGGKAGSFGRAAAFSFYPSKNLGAMGDAGLIATSDPDVAEAARWHRNIGQRTKGEHLVVGFNERLDTLQAAVLRVKLAHLDAWNESRRAAARRYDAMLPAAIGRVPRPEVAADVHHLYPIRVDDREHVRRALEATGIATGIHYSPAIHEHPVFADGQAQGPGLIASGGYPAAEAWARTELSLPMFPGLADDEVDIVCEALAAVV
jgi:dTDP-4-amino-4,6-dideoxygalactose transaminase